MDSFATPRTGESPVPNPFAPQSPHGLFLPGLLDESGDTHRCLSEVVDTFKGQARSKRLQVSLQFLARDYRLSRSPQRVRQVFSSLLQTAVEWAPAGGQITIRSTCPGEGVLRVEVMEHRRGHARVRRTH